MYDNICKFLAETFPTDIATWLLGRPIPLTQLSPKELSVEPIRADALILQQSEDLVLHTEFQTSPDREIPFRMADYRLRVYRRFPQKEMHQVVIYLRETGSELVYQNTFILTKLRHEFEIIRLWEQPTELFLNSPGLLPFAVLSQSHEKTDILREVAQEIATISNPRIQSNIAASTFILAGLVLKEEEIQRILRSDIMKESVTYQSIQREAREDGLREGLKEGLLQGLQEGRREAIEEIAQNLLRQGMTVEIVVRVTGLSLEKVQQLAE